MVICFDAGPEAKRALDALIATGQFKDSSEAISMALVNYQVIHCAVSKGEELLLENEPQCQLESPVAVSAKRASHQIAEPSPVRAKVAGLVAWPKLPALFGLQSASVEGLDLVPLPARQELGAVIVPPAKWLFGQYNKFLPVKASCRALLNLQQAQPAGVALNEALDTISKAAWDLGDYLYALDQRAKRSREDSFAAAFPKTASNRAGSLSRFANQFIGDLRQPKQDQREPKEVKFNGFPSALKFVGCTDGKKPLLRLTTAGAEFAALQNPPLDTEQNGSTRKFSEAETGFLLAHISRLMPEEKSAYAAIIDAIEEGENTPDEVDQYLARRFSLRSVIKPNADNEITKTFLTTQRTGAISRMADLGLIGREKNGLHVTYEITPLGQCFRKQIQ